MRWSSSLLVFSIGWALCHIPPSESLPRTCYFIIKIHIRRRRWLLSEARRLRTSHLSVCRSCLDVAKTIPVYRFGYNFV